MDDTGRLLPRRRALIVAAGKGSRRLILGVVRREGLRAHVVPDIKSGERALRTGRYGFAFVDLAAPGGDPSRPLDKFRRLAAVTGTVLFSGGVGSQGDGEPDVAAFGQPTEGGSPETLTAQLRVALRGRAPGSRKRQRRAAAARHSTGGTRSGPAAPADERRLAEQLRAIHEVSRDLLGTHETDRALQTVLENAGRLLPCDCGLAIAVSAGRCFVAAGLNVDARSIEEHAPAWEPAIRAWIQRWTKGDEPIVDLPDLLAGGEDGAGALSLGARSLLVLGLVVHGEVLGMLMLGNSAAPHAFVHDIEVARRYADLAAAVVGNSRLFEQLERQAFEEQYALLDVSASLLGVMDLPAACETVMQTALRSLKADACSIYLADEEGASPRLAASTVEPHVAPIEGGGDTVELPVRYAMADRLPVVSSDLQRETRFAVGEGLKSAGFRAQLVVPMLRQDEVVGAIALQWRRTRDFSTREIRTASLLGHQAALAAIQARLYQSVRQAQQELTRTNQELRGAYLRISRHASVIEDTTRITAEAVRNLDSDELFRRAAEFALRTVNAEDAWVVTVLDNQRRVWPATASGRPRIAGGDERWEVILRRVVETQKPLRAGSRGKHPGVVAVPLLEAGRVVGAIVAAGPGQRLFTAEDVKLLAGLGNQTVLAGRNIGLYRDLEAAYDATLAALVSALDVRDRETENHSQRVKRLTLEMGTELGYVENSPEWVELARGALLHDIGKIGVTDNILRKAGPLTPAEWREMQRHPEYGFKLLQNVPFLAGAAEIMYCHHERWDGGGYPRNLRAEEIPLGARIFSVADAFDAMVSNRPYRPARSFEAAAREVARCAGTQFDPGVVAAFQRFYVRLQPADVYGVEAHARPADLSEGLEGVA